jgi:hypothetical protein
MMLRMYLGDDVQENGHVKILQLPNMVTLVQNTIA